MREPIEKTIDIDSILRGKMGSKARYVPPFLVSWLKHITHQDEVNDFLWKHRHQTGTEWLEECVRYLDMPHTGVPNGYWPFQPLLTLKPRLFST